jgi:peptidoglycan LD-endopeptidase LytH
MTRGTRAVTAWSVVVLVSAAVSLLGLGWFAAVAYQYWVAADGGRPTVVELAPVPSIDTGSDEARAAPAAPRGAAAADGAAPALRDAAPPDVPATAPPTGLLPVGHDAFIEHLRQRHLTVPVAGVTRDALISTFHEARGARRHEALDILAPRGTPVLAVEDGTIAKLFTSDAGGLTIYQLDPVRLVSYYYAHLDRYADGVAEGAGVRRGDVLGYVGTTGNAQPDTPHLHFAIFRLGPEARWWEGEPVDPYLVLKE